MNSNGISVSVVCEIYPFMVTPAYIMPSFSSCLSLVLRGSNHVLSAITAFILLLLKPMKVGFFCDLDLDAPDGDLVFLLLV